MFCSMHYMQVICGSPKPCLCFVLLLLLLYRRHGPARAAHIEDFWRIIDWTQVSKNYASAKAGQIQSIVE